MRGGRPYSSRGTRGGGGNNSYASKFRASNGSYRDSDRYNSHSNENSRRYGVGNDISGSRSRYDQGASSDRFSHGRNDDNRSAYARNNSRSRADDSPGRKRARRDGNGGSRRNFGNNDRYDSGGRSNSSSHRRNNSNASRHSPAATPSKSNHSPRRGNAGEKTASQRAMGPPSRPIRKFGTIAKGSGGGFRDNGDESTARNFRRSKMGIGNRSNILRRRVVPLKQRDAARRVKIARLRSSLKKRDGGKTSKTDDEVKEKSEKKATKTDESVEKAVDSTEIDSAKKKQAITKKSTTTGEAASGDEAGVDEKDEGGEEEEDEEEVNNDGEKDENTDAKKAIEVDQTVDNEEVVETAQANADDKKDAPKTKKKRAKDNKERQSSRKFIELTCALCRVKCVTFKEYNSHLHSRSHKFVLGRNGLKQKTRLARMRLSQRRAQRTLEESSKETDNIAPQFCLLCRLNYRTPKDEHQASKAHREMKQFLTPYCDVCRISFKSPMTYEIHRCSLEHLRCKARRGRESGEKEAAGAEEDDDGNELQVDLDNFMTVDSVGDVDGGELLIEDPDNIAGEHTLKTAEKAQAEVNVGNEHVKKIEVYYCDLCRYYLPHLEDPEAALQKHCGTRNHLRAYLRYKENQSLKITAELIHRRDHEAKGDKKDAKLDESERKTSNSTTKTDDESADKVWDDVDKDLGDVIDQTTIETIETANEDEEEGSIERYDRFKNSEKSEEASDDGNADKESETPVDAEKIEHNGVASTE